MLNSGIFESVETRTAAIRMMQAMRPSTNGKISSGKSMLARRSDTVRDVVFTNRNLFPSYNELPVVERECFLRTHYREACFDTYLPIKAWFFLGEIIHLQGTVNSQIHHRILVRNREGRSGIAIDFHNSSTTNTVFDYSRLKRDTQSVFICKSTRIICSSDN